MGNEDNSDATWLRYKNLDSEYWTYTNSGTTGNTFKPTNQGGITATFYPNFLNVMKPIKNTLLLVNGNIDSTDSYTKTQIGDQSGNFWIESSNTEYSNDTANIDAPDYHKSIKFAENCV